MSSRQTEARHDQASGLDLRDDNDILQIIMRGQADAVLSLNSALPDIATGAHKMAATIEAGGRLIYAAAGSSGLMALADASELHGTYGIGHDQVRILMAGGVPVDAVMPGGTEDDDVAAERDAEVANPGDTVIVLSASGSTIYAVALARAATARGATIVAIANNADAPLFDGADVAIHAPTPPEVVAGSTRMNAGTAQKAVLNMMSTLMGIRLGHVHDGMMVNVIADNEKLQGRAAGIVASVAGVPEDTAYDCLTAAHGVVKPAVLLAGGAAPDEAQSLLNETRGRLRPALDRLRNRH